MARHLLKRASVAAKPASGATIVLYDSEVTPPPGGQIIKTLVLRVRASHAGVASSLILLQKSLSGDTYYSLDTDERSQAALAAGTPFTIHTFTLAASRFKLTYANDANTLTAWEYELFGDT